MHTSILASALFLASTALATNDYGSGGSGGYGGGSYSSDSGSGGWSSWETSTSTVSVAPAVAAPSDAAASTPPAAPPMAPSSGELIVQVVSVADANGSLKYFPNSVQAPVGSIVQFQFHPKNHTITESTFSAPCMPVAVSNASLITPTRPGLKSGFVPVTGTEADTPVYNVLINDTKPIWLYCGQTNHCQKGMAMVINQNLTSTEKTIEAYIAAAMAMPLAATNATAPPAGGMPGYGVPSAGTSGIGSTAPAAASTSVVVVPPPVASTTDTASAVLPPPTGVAASTTAVSPATFTGAASQQRIDSKGVVAAVAFVGLAAML